MKRFAIGIRVTLGLGLLGMIATSNPAPQNRAEIDAYAQQLFEFGAIRYVHGLDSPHIAENQSLFDQVRSGAPLDHATSCTYRRAYLMVLQDYARRFQLADDDLQMADDFGIDHANNCDGTGIAGNHDLHDLSAKANVTELLDNLEILQSGTGWVNGIILINEVQKNLVDLTVHMAPAVQSIGVQAPDFDLAGADPIAQSYRDMLGHFKDAQFADINGPAYWDGVDAALANYGDIVASAQEIIVANSGQLQRRIAGRWLSLQTVAPQLDTQTCLRPQPHPTAPICR